MKNLVITAQNYLGNHGHNYRSLNAKLDGKNIHTSLTGNGIVDFTEQAIEQAIHSAILDDFTPIDLTVEAPLSEGAQSIISDKYAGDPLIASIQFA